MKQNKVNRLIRECLNRTRINAVGVPMPGPPLPQRIRKIIEAGAPTRISRIRVACVIADCAITCATFIAGRLTRAQSPLTDWEKAAGGKTSFDVASVKEAPKRQSQRLQQSRAACLASAVTIS
jgi:hypothetical protein